jgi:hypothetical protein
MAVVPQNLVAMLADAGLPMIFVTFPLMVCALVPVILVEIWVAKPKLGATYAKSAWAVGLANVVSTVIGVPLAWIVVLGLELLTDRLFNDRLAPVSVIVNLILGPAWIGPPDSGHDWIIPAAAMILLIPTFFASWYIEAFIVDKMLDLEWPVVRKAMLRANLASYALLFIGGCGWLIFDVTR